MEGNLKGESADHNVWAFWGPDSNKYYGIQETIRNQNIGNTKKSFKIFLQVL